MMTYKKWILRILRVAGLAALAVVLLTFAAVQYQQWMLRWRAERLMADMHQIRLYQSTWADAQRLMHRWEPGGTTTVAARRRTAGMKLIWRMLVGEHGIDSAGALAAGSCVIRRRM